MIRIAVCDDNQECLDKEKTIVMRYLAQCEQEYKVDAFISGKSLLESFKLYDYDLIMLDVELRDMNGMELAQQLHEINENTPIAFISAYMKYASEGYYVNAIRFILKDEDIQVYIEECLDLLMKTLQADKKIITLEFTIGERSIKVSDILYLRRSGNYTVFVVNNHEGPEELKQRRPLMKISSQMAEYDFVSVNAGNCVNLAHVDRISGKTLLMDNGESFDVPRRKYDYLMRAYKIYKRGKGL